MNIFIPMEANKYGLLSTIPQKNSFIKIVKINLTEIWGPEKFKNYCYKKNYAMPPMQTVLVAALYIAINIGYKKIFLVGADQNWHENIKITRRNIITYEDAHFYKPNDTIPTLDTNSNRTAFFSMSNFFITISRVFSGHEELARYSKYMHSLIFNASEKSYIDAYKRIVIPNNK
jgi:DNA-binding transcriptional regulator/RsmH inhibitor MraZ